MHTGQFIKGVMMDPKDFLKTIYLGDRGCKSLLIDGWNNRVVFQITTISRVRSSSGNWDYYSDEDIADGFIVFTEVESIKLDPPGYLPNDFIDDFSVEQISLDGPEEEMGYKFLFKFKVGSVSNEGHLTEVLIQIIAKGVHLEDPNKPGVIITE